MSLALRPLQYLMRKQVEELTKGRHQECELMRSNTGKNTKFDLVKMDRLMAFFRLYGVGAWTLPSLLRNIFWCGAGAFSYKGQLRAPFYSK